MLFCAVRICETSSGVRISGGTRIAANDVTWSGRSAETGAVSGSIPSCCERWRRNLAIPCQYVFLVRGASRRSPKKRSTAAAIVGVSPSSSSDIGARCALRSTVLDLAAEADRCSIRASRIPSSGGHAHAGSGCTFTLARAVVAHWSRWRSGSLVRSAPAISFDQSRHVALELPIRHDAGHSSGFGRSPILDVNMRTKGKRRHEVTIVTGSLLANCVPGDCTIHVDNADRHRAWLLAQCLDKLLCRADEATLQPQAGQRASNARPEKQVAVQDDR